VVSLTFLEAWRLRARLHPGDGELTPWVFGTTVNVLRNVTRASRRYAHSLHRIPPPDAVPDIAGEIPGSPSA
jgi:RNA polymerase sigma-70 factor (ECF subfamily)